LALHDGTTVTAVKMPDTACAIARAIESLMPDVAFIEDVWGHPTDGRASVFRFGTNFGIVLGVLAALHIEVRKVLPALWQVDMGLAQERLPKGSILSAKEKGKRKRDHKAMIRKRAQKRWPRAKLTSATADAAWIAAWGFIH